jgi:hypothetical protein
MPKSVKRCCGTCRWGLFYLYTNHKPPRVKPEAVGQCEWPLPKPSQVADSVKRLGCVRVYVVAQKHSECPTWEAQK